MLIMMSRIAINYWDISSVVWRHNSTRSTQCHRMTSLTSWRTAAAAANGDVHRRGRSVSLRSRRMSERFGSLLLDHVTAARLVSGACELRCVAQITASTCAVNLRIKPIYYHVIQQRFVLVSCDVMIGDVTVWCVLRCFSADRALPDQALHRRLQPWRYWLLFNLLYMIVVFVYVLFT